MNTPNVLTPETRARNIFDIEIELVQIAESYDQLAETGAGDDEIQQAIFVYFGDLVQERDTKLDNYVRLIRTKEAHAEARKAEAKRLQALAQTDENAAKSLKLRLQQFFEFVGIKKTETRFHKLCIQGNGGARGIKVWEDPTEATFVHPAYHRFVIKTETTVTRFILDPEFDGSGVFFNSPYIPSSSTSGSYTWDTEAIRAYLLGVEAAANVLANSAADAMRESIDAERKVAADLARIKGEDFDEFAGDFHPLRVAEDIKNAGDDVRHAYWSEHGLPFATLEPQGQHLRIK